MEILTVVAERFVFLFQRSSGFLLEVAVKKNKKFNEKCAYDFSAFA